LTSEQRQLFVDTFRAYEDELAAEPD
jgi:hypothetical protein